MFGAHTLGTKLETNSTNVNLTASEYKKKKSVLPLNVYIFKVNIINQGWKL